MLDVEPFSDELLRDPYGYHAGRGGSGQLQQGAAVPAQEPEPGGADPSNHTRARTILSRILSPRAVTQVRESFAKEADSLLDGVMVSVQRGEVVDGIPRIHPISHEGQSTELQVPNGHSVTQAAAADGVRGIVGECSGSAVCATCHVYIDHAWLDRLTPALSHELELLECTSSERRPESRLSCQVKVHTALDGMVVRMPATQQ